MKKYFRDRKPLLDNFEPSNRDDIFLIIWMSIIIGLIILWGISGSDTVAKENGFSLMTMLAGAVIMKLRTNGSKKE